MTNTITIGKRYFEGEKRAYECWTTALIREMIQNSSDAPNSRQIFFIVVGGLISIRDDGNGMTREVLTNVFMNLGESTKKTADTCGGFGIARNLICFAQESYEIRSHDYLVKGSGSGYTITDMPMIRGCCFTIQTEIDDEGFWLEKIRDVLSPSNIKQHVYLNGISFQNTNHRGRHIRTMKCGEVYVNKSDKTNYVHVRSNGVWMFSKYMNMGATVYVEVTPEISKKVFTSNRDGMQSEYRNELDEFLRELASETLSALKPKNRQYVRIVRKGSAFQVNPIKFGKAASVAPKTDEQLNQTHNPTPYCGQMDVYVQTPVTFDYIDPLLKCSISVCETNDAKIVAISSKFDPAYLQTHTTRYKLLKTWQIICDAVVKEYAEWSLTSQFYGIGWHFNTQDMRACVMSGEQFGEVKYLLLNPIDNDGKIAYSLNDKRDLAKLISLSCHEVTHLCGGINYHDERFAAIMTDLTARVMANLSAIFRAIKQ